MSTLAEPDINVKLLKEGRRFERPDPLQAVSDSQRWSARCMYLDCHWAVEGLLSEAAARTGGEIHHGGTGHTVKLRAVIEFDCGIIRSETRRT